MVEREEKEFYAKGLWQALEGGVGSEIWREYGLDEVAQAHQDLEGRKTTGKLLIKP